MNPVLRENLDVLFDQGHVLSIYFYLLALLAPVAFVALYSQSLGDQMWRGSAMLLKVCMTAAVVLIVYFALRLANQEYAPERFKPLASWLHERRRGVGIVARGRLASLLVHIACLVLLTAPFLIWAGAISHTPLPRLVATLALIPVYAFCYGVWGLVTFVLYERERETREFAARLLVFLVVVAALAVYLPLNPVVYVLGVLGQEELEPLSIAGSRWSADTIHFSFHFVLGSCGLIAHRRVLKHVLERGHR